MQTETLSDEICVTIAALVRSGYGTPTEMAQVAMEMHDFDGDGALVNACFDREIDRLKQEQICWPKVTDYDRLRSAFDNLESQGVVCRENFSCCQNCGSSEIEEVVAQEQERGRSILGSVFFHQQDTEHAVEGGGLYFAYRANLKEGADPKSERDIAIGHRLVQALKQEGLEIHWNGDLAHRIHAKLDWKRRWIGAAS